MPRAAVAATALRLQALVEATPGLHFRALGRAGHVTSVGQLRHHVDRLVRAGLVREVADGRYVRLFPAGARDAEGAARLCRPVTRRIARQLLAGPRSRTDLRRALGCADSTLGYHLARLRQAGDVQRLPQDGRYALRDPDAVRARLEAQNPAPHRIPAARPAAPTHAPAALLEAA